MSGRERERSRTVACLDGFRVVSEVGVVVMESADPEVRLVMSMHEARTLARMLSVRDPTLSVILGRAISMARSEVFSARAE